MALVAVVRLPRLCFVAAELIVASDLGGGEQSAGFEVRAQMDGAQLAAEKRDPRRSRAQIGVINRPGTEGHLECPLLGDNLLPQAARFPGPD